jgi:CRP-like cAMP-binding protein
MMPEDVMLLGIASIILIIAVITTLRNLVKARELNRQIEDSSTIVEGIVSELRNRLNNQDGKLIDQEVKTEILELKVARLLQEPPKPMGSLIHPQRAFKPNVDVVQQAVERDITYLPVKDVKKSDGLTETEQEILREISVKNLTTAELQNSLGKTREHTARLLKKLFDAGYIERDESTKPYSYRLSKKRDRY